VTFIAAGLVALLVSPARGAAAGGRDARGGGGGDAEPLTANLGTGVSAARSDHRRPSLMFRPFVIVSRVDDPSAQANPMESTVTLKMDKVG
jgi:hypothetical protein